MNYINGFLSAKINDAEKNKQIGKEVEKGNCEFSHFAIDSCYYRQLKNNKQQEATLIGSELDKAIEKQEAFIRGVI